MRNTLKVDIRMGGIIRRTTETTRDMIVINQLGIDTLIIK